MQYVNRCRFVLFIAVLVCLSAIPATAQSPNTGSVMVTVVDQNDAVVRGANVTVINTATGEKRETVSDDNGRVNIAGLPLTGEYKVSVAMTGFTAEEANSAGQYSRSHHSENQRRGDGAGRIESCRR